jgi:uncharacterized protein (TIGR02452 family)
MRYVLAVAAERGHRTLVLGAWGCGAFRNDPWVVAPLFREAIDDETFVGAFDCITMAVYDTRKEQNIWRAFAASFDTPRGR